MFIFKEFTIGSKYLVLLLLLGLMAGCASRNTTNIPNPESITSEDPVFLFVEQLAIQPKGVSQYFVDSPLGVGEVSIKNDYFSASGEKCRAAQFTSTVETFPFAICQNKTKQWVLIPTIFEKVMR